MPFIFLTLNIIIEKSIQPLKLMISPCLNTYIIPKRMFKKKKRIRHAFGNQNDVAKFRNSEGQG